VAQELADEAAAAASTGDRTDEAAKAKLIQAEESARRESQLANEAQDLMTRAEYAVRIAEMRRAEAQASLERRIKRAESHRRQPEEAEAIRRVDELAQSAHSTWILHHPETEDAIRQRDTILSWLDIVIRLSKTSNLFRRPGWLTEAEHAFAQLQSVNIDDEVHLNEILGNLLRRTHLEIGDNLSPEDSRSIARVITEFDERAVALRQAAALKRIETAERQATSAAESAKKAAGAAGDAALSGHFESYASKEYLRSYLYLGGGIFSLLGALAGAAVVLWGDSISGLGWRGALKALVSLPILGLAYYLSRESSAHSEAARRAHEIEVRLQTIEAFTEVMPEAQR
jgi:hypothetical protein